MNINPPAGRSAHGLVGQEENALDRRRRRILSATKPVFLKYGYHHLTMEKLARAAGMSRAALYLVFPNKGDFFGAAIRELAREASAEAHRGLQSARSPLGKLRFVCEVWMVRPFDWRQTPEAKDIYESSHAFAEPAVSETVSWFERDLTTVIEGFPRGALPRGISHAHAAYLLAGALLGIQGRCRRSDELRQEIHALIGMMFRS